MRDWIRRLLVVVAFLGAAPAWAGSIFLTGHDPDFHATLGGNTAGAINITNAAIDFVTDPLFNPFSAGGVNRFLFVESSISPPGGHTVGMNGILAAGYASGTDFVHADASTLDAELHNLGTVYNAIVIASDFGGILTQAELNILNADAALIRAFIEAGGGLYAMAESGLGAGLTTSGQYGYLPFVTSTAALNQSEVGNTVTPFGLSLGLTNSDVNGNASHNVFTSSLPLAVVDLDAAGRVLSIAGRLDVIPPGPVVPEPTTMVLLSSGLLATRLVRRKRR